MFFTVGLVWFFKQDFIFSKLPVSYIVNFQLATTWKFFLCFGDKRVEGYKSLVYKKYSMK